MHYLILVCRGEPHTDRNVKIIHVITGISSGGAEMMLYKLLSHLDRTRFEAEVVSLTGLSMSPLGRKIESLGIPVRILGMRPRLPDIWGVYQLACWLRRTSPHLVQTWMYHADLIGGLAAKLASGIPVVWNIRYSALDITDLKRTTHWTMKACARGSHWLPTQIVCCAESARQFHMVLGYATEKMVVIPNGFDLAVFKPDSAARFSVRYEFDIPEETPLIGLVANFLARKDHWTFIQAAARLHADLPEVHFLLCGEWVTWDNPELNAWITEAGLGECCHLLGHRQDIPRLMAALDLATLTSADGEGFSNVIGEAMACGVSCVVTDVGDTALIVGNSGKVVPPRDPPALAQAWRTLLMVRPRERVGMGRAARRRIEEQFSLPVIVDRYQRLYENLCNQKEEISHADYMGKREESGRRPLPL